MIKLCHIVINYVAYLPLIYYLFSICRGVLIFLQIALEYNKNDKINYKVHILTRIQIKNCTYLFIIIKNIIATSNMNSAAIKHK